MTPRKRRLRVTVGHVEAKTDWAGSTLTVSGWRNGKPVEAVIEIRTPYDYAYLLQHLQKIPAQWKKTLQDFELL